MQRILREVKIRLCLNDDNILNEKAGYDTNIQYNVHFNENYTELSFSSIGTANFSNFKLKCIHIK